MGARLDRLVTAFAALLLVGFGLLPLANWIHGGVSAPWYGEVAADLLNGAAIAAGVGLVAAILFRKRRFARTPWSVCRGWWESAPRLATAAIALAALAAYLIVARWVLSGRPLLIDEIIQVYQARMLAGGHLSLPAAPHQEFFSSFHVVEQGGRVFGQFPMGGPAMLAFGTLLGGEWLVGPVFGALAVLAFAALLRRIEPRPGVALAATLLFGFAPFALFMSGSHMNHVTALCWLVIAMLALARAATDAGRFRDGLLTGLAFGVAATIRPVDALAFSLPAALWLLVRAARRRRLAALLGAGLGIVAPVLLLAWSNLQTTGAPLLFGYTVLWGRAHDLGFHATPWGPVHTPLHGLELVSLYFLRLQSYLFEAAGPSLLPATAALGLTRKLRPFDRYLLASSTLLVGSYFAYWHDGFYLGPRFMYPLLPLLALWTARLPAALRERVGDGLVLRATVAALLVATALGLGTALPIRVHQYQSWLLSLRWDPDRGAKTAGVAHALVLVRESWGAELLARMWALGVSRPDAEVLYRAADPCRLGMALAELERRSIRGAAAVAALAPLRGDSVRLANAEAITGDPSLRVTPGIQYPEQCVTRIEENRRGFTLFPPLLLARRFDNVYARDLGARDSVLLRDYPGRPVYLLKPASGAEGAEPVFYRLRSDSLLAAWRGQR